MSHVTVNGISWYALPINPEPWAIGPLGVGRKNGKYYPYVGKNQQLAAYQDAVREEFSDAQIKKIEGRVRVRFFFWRERAEYTTPQARTHRKHEADLTNLQKALEDALQDIFFDNDRDVNSVESVLVRQGPNVVGKILVAVSESPPIPDAVINLPTDVYQMMDSFEESIVAVESSNVNTPPEGLPL